MPEKLKTGQYALKLHLFSVIQALVTILKE